MPMTESIQRSPDFIEVFENALSAEFCQQLIQAFEGSGRKLPGEVGGGVMKELKDSDDILVSGPPEWRQAEDQINAAIFPCLLTYLRRHAYTVLAPLMLQKQSPDGKRVQLDADDIANMAENDLANLVRTVFRPGKINIQRYRAGKGGYPYWHCETYPKDESCEALHRTLLWTTYLNDDFAAGETEFYYQGRLITPQRGAALIAPSGFTHTHRGNTPQGGDKYIATSWILFQRAEVLFAKQ